MAQDVFLVGFDGTDPHPIDFALDRAAKAGARLLIVHVLEWSPYSFLTTQELAERHKTREQEMARAREVVLKPMIDKAQAAGIAAEGELRYGHVADILCAVARDKAATMIFVGRSSRLSQRVFGSAASGVVQCAAVPVVIVP